MLPLWPARSKHLSFRNQPCTWAQILESLYLKENDDFETFSNDTSRLYIKQFRKKNIFIQTSSEIWSLQPSSHSLLQHTGPRLVLQDVYLSDSIRKSPTAIAYNNTRSWWLRYLTEHNIDQLPGIMRDWTQSPPAQHDMFPCISFANTNFLSLMWTAHHTVSPPDNNTDQSSLKIIRWLGEKKISYNATSRLHSTVK